MITDRYRRHNVTEHRQLHLPGPAHPEDHVQYVGDHSGSEEGSNHQRGATKITDMNRRHNVTMDQKGDDGGTKGGSNHERGATQSNHKRAGKSTATQDAKATAQGGLDMTEENPDSSMQHQQQQPATIRMMAQRQLEEVGDLPPDPSTEECEEQLRLIMAYGAGLLIHEAYLAN